MTSGCIFVPDTSWLRVCKWSTDKRGRTSQRWGPRAPVRPHSRAPTLAVVPATFGRSYRSWQRGVTHPWTAARGPWNFICATAIQLARLAFGVGLSAGKAWEGFVGSVSAPDSCVCFWGTFLLYCSDWKEKRASFFFSFPVLLLVLMLGWPRVLCDMICRSSDLLPGTERVSLSSPNTWVTLILLNSWPLAFKFLLTCAPLSSSKWPNQPVPPVSCLEVFLRYVTTSYLVGPWWGQMN